MNITQNNHFPLPSTDTKTNVLFFDIFFKNNKIYLILPIYNQPYSTNDIFIKVDNNPKPLIVTTKYIKNEYEPILIYIYDYYSSINTNTIHVSVEYKNIVHSYSLEHIVTTMTNKLTLTTLFKDDYETFPFFYKYYKDQGVSHFYLYYNGRITPEIYEYIKSNNDNNDITLIEWDFHYWNFLDEDKDKTIAKGEYLYAHHAQMGQIHHAIYRYGKELNEYMIFCDFDEYLYIPKTSLLQFILQYPTIELIGFRNKWADLLDEKKHSNNQFPSKLITSSTIFNYGVRSKNIYKLSSVNTIYIHFCRNFNKPNIISYIDFYMFHFYKWSDPNRVILETCNIVENILT